MINNIYIPLHDRAVIEISGDDGAKFLQGIITNDINKVTEKYSIYALLLTPQGKFLFDFFICKMNGSYILECDLSRVDEFIKRLNMYRLRSDVTIKNISDKYEIVALLGDNISNIDGFEEVEEGLTRQFCKGVAYIDPRTKKLYARSIIERENNYQSFKVHGLIEGKIEEYLSLRINCLIVDMEAEKSFPMQFKMEELNAIDFDKGCYVGQEVTARSKYRGNIKKSVFRVKLESKLPDKENQIFSGEKKIGILLSSYKNRGVAMLDIAIVEGREGIALKHNIETKKLEIL